MLSCLRLTIPTEQSEGRQEAKQRVPSSSRYYFSVSSDPYAPFQQGVKQLVCKNSVVSMQSQRIICHLRHNSSLNCLLITSTSVGLFLLKSIFVYGT